MSDSVTTPRLWKALGLTAMAGLAAVQVQASPLHGQTADQPADILLAQDGEAGEGGGEMGAAAGAQGAVPLLAGLSLMEGHLRSGGTLYAEGHPSEALTHMKHPQDEIYTDLVPGLDAAGIAGFADELTALAAAVEGGAPVEDALAAQVAVLARFQEVRDALAAPAAEQIAVMTLVLRTAAEEYGIGVIDGEISNLHEYQDAHGFVQTVKVQAELLAGSSDAATAAAGAAILAALVDTDPAFEQGLMPAGGLVTDGVPRLLGAAARTELAGLELLRQ
jgi:hypothetical protein